MKWIATVLVCIWCVSFARATEKPNIVFILSDDIGYGDVGCYGATKVKTPNIDKLAAEGRRFTNNYAPSAMCSPTRYAIMTGQYAWRNPALVRGVLSGVAPATIKPGRFTLPGMLKQAGYATGAVGKWHLGMGDPKPDYNGELKPGPLEIGFDYYFGYPATNDRVPTVYIENHRVVNLDPKDPIEVNYQHKVGDEPTGKEHPELETTQKSSHGHDDTIVNGVGRIGYMSGGKAARFDDATQARVLTGKAVDFIEQHKGGAQPFFLYFATRNIHVPRVSGPDFAGKSAAGPRGDSIEELDWSVGQVMEALARNGLDNNTLVIFSSDNGGVMDDGYQDGSGNDTSGHKCNGSLRGFKAGIYEGGTRVPLITRWAGHIQHGECDEIISLGDLLASCAALVGQSVPDDAGPDSQNVLPALLGQPHEKPGRTEIVTHAGSGILAIRVEQWKFIERPMMKKNNPKGPGGELYDLASDPSESKDVAKDNREVVERLQKRLDEIRSSGRSRP